MTQIIPLDAGWFADQLWKKGVPSIWRDDLVQECLIRQWRYPHVYGILIVRSVVVDFWRRERRHPTISLDVPVDEMGHTLADFLPSLGDVFDTTDSFIDLQKQLAVLTPRERACLEASLSGTAVNGNRNSTKAGLSIARKKLRAVRS